jgi:hypothetical protein
MSRRGQDQAESAAKAASEAARVLQQRGQEARAAQQDSARSVEPSPEPENHGEPATIRVKPRNEPRRLAMEEIEARDLQTKGIVEPAPAPAKVPDNPPPPTPEQMLEGGKFSAPEPEKPKPEAEPAAEPTPAPIKTVRVKVDGEEFDAPADEVEQAGGVRPYQIQKASENRLKKAGEALAEAQRYRAEIGELARQAKQPPAAPVVTDDQFIASKADAMRFGTPEEFASAMREVLQRSNKQIDQNALVTQAANMIRHDQAVAEFDKEFGDVTSNPLLLKLVVTLRNEQIPQIKGPVDWTTFYRTIGNQVRSVAGRPSQPATTVAVAAATSGTTSQSPSDREARKASIVNLPTAAARAELPKDSKPETREDILQQMRKSRGIPTG